MTKHDVLKAQFFFYQVEGTLVRALPVSQVPSAMRELGWRNVSRLDEHALRNMGLRIAIGRYVKAGGKLAQPCKVVMGEQQ